jgi:hypothetical protein
MTDAAKEDTRDENTKKFMSENLPNFPEIDRETEGIN